MRDIAHDSGISLSGIYYYTRGKSSLLYEIQSRTIDALIASAAQALPASPDQRISCSSSSRTTFPTPTITRLSSACSRTKPRQMAPTSAREAVELKRHEYVQVLRDILDRVRQEYSAPVSTQFAADMLFAMMSGPRQWGVTDTELNVGIASRMIYDLFVHGFTGGEAKARAYVTEFIAHRGVHDVFTENTLDAFQRALDLGFHAIELDVHVTADGVCVVHHDESVITPKVALSIRGTYFNTLQAAAPLLPRLDAVLDLVAQKAHAYVEIKNSDVETELAEVIRADARRGLGPLLRPRSGLAHEALAAATSHRDSSDRPARRQRERATSGRSYRSLAVARVHRPRAGRTGCRHRRKGDRLDGEHTVRMARIQ